MNSRRRHPATAASELDPNALALSSFFGLAFGLAMPNGIRRALFSIGKERGAYPQGFFVLRTPSPHFRFVCRVVSLRFVRS